MIRDFALCALAFAGFAAAQGITGRVLEDHSGSPLASVEVRVHRAGAPRLVADLETEPNGEFRLPPLAPGDYRFEFLKTNYLGTTLQFTKSVPTAVAVRLVRCGVISGRVLDQQGQPVRGAVVYAMPTPEGGAALRPVAKQAAGSYAQTDQDGRYKLFYLAPGEYAVAASYGASSMVLGMTGSAAVNAAVGSGVVLYPSAARPEYLTIAGGEEYRNIDLNIPLSTFYSVSGKVDFPAASDAIGRFWLTLARIELPSLATAAAEAGSEGAFRFEGISPGSYYLFASGPSRARNSRGSLLPAEPYFARSRVEVIAQNVEGIVLSPQKGGAAAFVMRAPPEARSACPESAQLSLTALEDWAAALDRTTPVTFKEQPLRNLAPARYEARLDDLGALCYQASPVTLDLSSEAPESVVIEVKAAGALHGKLAGATRPADFMVALLASGETSSERVVLAAAPDPQGRFSFERLRPGKYFVTAQPAGESRTRWIADPARMLQIEIRGGSATDLELPVAAVQEGEGK